MKICVNESKCSEHKAKLFTHQVLNLTVLVSFKIAACITINDCLGYGCLYSTLRA